MQAAWQCRTLCVSRRQWEQVTAIIPEEKKNLLSKREWRVSQNKVSQENGGRDPQRTIIRETQDHNQKHRNEQTDFIFRQKKKRVILWRIHSCLEFTKTINLHHRRHFSLISEDIQKETDHYSWSWPTKRKKEAAQ